MGQTQDYKVFLNKNLLKQFSPENDLPQKINHQLQKMLNQYPNVADIVTRYTPHALSEEEGEVLVKILILKDELSRINNTFGS